MWPRARNIVNRTGQPWGYSRLRFLTIFSSFYLKNSVILRQILNQILDWFVYKAFYTDTIPKKHERTVCFTS